MQRTPGRVVNIRSMWLLVLSGAALAGSALVTALPGSAADSPAAAAPVFEKNILPVLQAKCVRCHGGDKQKAGLDVRTRAALLEGGDSGPALVPGAAAKSPLWEKVLSDKMPPGKDKLTSAEKELLRTWIDKGAAAQAPAAVQKEEPKDRQVTDEDRKFWAFRSPVRPAVPQVKQAERVRNPIDAFLLAELEKKGLSLAPEAGRLTLLRRAFFDLVGLPPSPQEIDAFLADSSPDAYEKLIDRLLASEHHGERWGRHWLDLAGYADSEGILDADYVRSAAWRYRDYVIRAFNQDKPYDRFLKEQLAGDELVDYWTAYRSQKELRPEVVEALVATGYLRCASDTSRPDFVNIKNAPGYYYQTLDDTVKIVASSTLALTLECARCHSHKYDPIPQTDYYRIQAIFMSGYRPSQWVPQVQRRLTEGTEVQEKELNAQVDAAVVGLRRRLEELRRGYGEHWLEERLARLPVAIRADVRLAVRTEPARRNEVQKYLASRFEKELKPDPKALVEHYPEYKSQSLALEASLKIEDARRRSLPEIRAFYDLPGEVPTPLLRRGDYLQPGRPVAPGVLSVLATARPFNWTPPARDARTSGRRLAFAEWLTQPDHPLTARVLVNRLWLHHFGEGIVTTADNFGHMGARPSHPQLLDWLATEFVARGWSLKAMHRLIMTSSAYRQTSTITGEAKRLDPENRLFGRQRLRRLEAEALRDAVLTAAGTLNPQMYGPPVPMQRQPDGEVTTPADAAGKRRSVYLQVRRSQPLTLLQVFDQPVMETNCTRRGVSTVSSQALTLLNSDFLVQQGEAMADRALRDNAADPVGQAVRLAFGRPATEKEKERLKAFLDAQAVRREGALTGGRAQATVEQRQQARRRALADLCQMLLSANEFAYVD